VINADLLSSAMFVGWAQSGFPWRNAVGLICLAAAAMTVPIVFKRNIYCDHLCPHGALQQLLPRRWKIRTLPRWGVRGLRLIRPVLLTIIVLVPMLGWSMSLVDLEPFDAYAWRAAGVATVSIAVAGLGLSLFIPMAYCRYGCPTGAVLDYLRRNSRSDRLTAADGLAVLLCAIAFVCYRI
jgi:NosR/NirI family nitrous oxide reductase transcriptional regulator